MGGAGTTGTRQYVGPTSRSRGRFGAESPAGAGSDADNLDRVAQQRLPTLRWQRGDDPEFSRPINFTDAVFAIALTLLALDLRIDRLAGDADSITAMWQAIGDLAPQLVAYVVAFYLLGRYWVAHHRFAARLQAVDSRFMALTLVYLAFVAVLPFPTSLIGAYEGNPLSGAVFALNLAAISGLETLLLVHAQRSDLLRDRGSEAMQRWEVVGSLTPAAVFTATIPLAFVDPSLMLVSWLVLGVVLGRWSDRVRPAR